MTARIPTTMREITAPDLPRVHEIAVAGWRPIYARYRLIVGQEMWTDLWGNWEEGWFAYTPETWKGKGIVTEVGGEVAGFATWWYASDVLPEVGGNAVDPGFQGQGIGSAQIRWVVEMFRGQGHRFAKVHTGLDPAHGPARAEYRNAGLRLGVANSVYLNYLDEVARIPVPQGLSFRWAEPGDAEMARHLVRCAWTGAHETARQTLGEALFAAAFGDAVERRADEVAGLAGGSDQRLRLAMAAGRVVGFCAVHDEAAKKLGTIEAVGVVAESRNQGVGAALCMDAFAIFRERGLRYGRFLARLGETSERVRRLCWNVGLYRELPSIDYYMYL